MSELTERYGPVVRMRVGPATLLLVTDPAEVAALISNHERQLNLPKLKEAYFSVEFVSAPSLSAMSPECRFSISLLLVLYPR